MLRSRSGKDNEKLNLPTLSDDGPSKSPMINKFPLQEPLCAEGSRKKALETFVLGGEREFWSKLEKRDEKEEKHVEAPDEQPNQESSDAVIGDQRKPAWQDEDDNQLIAVPRKRKLAAIVETMKQQDGKVAPDEYSERLKKHFVKAAVNSSLVTPSWADLSGKKSRKRGSSDSDSESEDDVDHINDLSKRTGSYVGTSASLTKGMIQCKKLRDVTSGYRIKAILTSVEFNKQTEALLVSGYTQRVQIYKIDGRDNPLLQSATFDGFPIERAHFSANGERVYVGSKLYQYFYYYDLMAGKVVKVPQIRSLKDQRMAKFVVSPDGNLLVFEGPHGNIHLISTKTHERICTLKMNGRLNALAFSSNGSALYSHGDDGQVYVWDIRNRICVHRFFDDGCVKGLSIAASSDDKYLATGSNTGVVNIYDVNALRDSTAPMPLKSIMNLTTAATSLQFNPTSEMLAMASDIKSKQMKLFHTKSLTTFENFPSFRDKLTNIQCMDFSLNSGYMCVGCENGRAFLYRLLHYENY